jgi:hypothetical protein
MCVTEGRAIKIKLAVIRSTLQFLATFKEGKKPLD